MKRMRWPLLLAAVIIEVGCGLPDIFYLFPPNVSGLLTTGTPVATISGTSRALDIDCQFTGYELYYKFYAPNDPGSTYLQDQNYGGPNNTVSDLQQHGFQRVCLGPGSVAGEIPDTGPGYSSAPLINIKVIDPVNLTNSGYTITITFNNTNLTGPLATFMFDSTFNLTTIPVSYFTYAPPFSSTPIAGMEIRRFVQSPPYFESGSHCLPFTSNYDFVGQNPLPYDPSVSNEVDITPLQGVWSAYVSPGPGMGPGLLYVMMYAVSYGVGTDQTPRRSSPTYMGYTQIQVILAP